MEDFKKQRDSMVEAQLIARGIQDKLVLDAMRKVPRHLFVGSSMQSRAYDDMAIPIGDDQTISQPYMVAIMTELLELTGDEKVLEIGTGSGYQAAVLAELSREVYTVERIPALAQKAQELFKRLNYKNINVKTADGSLGWPEHAPFDRILITAGAPSIPEPITDQLSEGGILTAPIGDRFYQKLVIIKKSKGILSETFHIPCVFVPLIGEYGWKEDNR